MRPTLTRRSQRAVKPIKREESGTIEIGLACENAREM
jgi:hypothetical protein